MCQYSVINSSTVYTEADAFPSCCPVLWDLLNNSGVSDETSCQRTIWTAVSTTLSVSHLESPSCRQRPDLTVSILTNRDLTYTYDAQTLIKRTEQANKHQKGTRRLKKYDQRAWDLIASWSQCINNMPQNAAVLQKHRLVQIQL